MAYPTIDQLCKGFGPDLQKVLEGCKERRSVHRQHSNGYSPKRLHRNIAEIPRELFLHPRSPFKQFFDNAHDAHERRKHIYEFLRKYPEFMTVDKL